MGFCLAYTYYVRFLHVVYLIMYTIMKYLHFIWWHDKRQWHRSKVKILKREKITWQLIFVAWAKWKKNQIHSILFYIADKLISFYPQIKIQHIYRSALVIFPIWKAESLGSTISAFEDIFFEQFVHKSYAWG